MSERELQSEQTMREIFERFNEPVIPMESLRRWLDQFDSRDRETALLLLNSIEFHSQPRMRRETGLLHQKLCTRLSEDCFDIKDFQDVDFSREFTCKSGDVVSFIYRKSNLIPSVDFKTMDRLAIETSKNPMLFRDRALVILDDYIGTGSQFIFQFIGLSDEDIQVMNAYRKTYLVCYVIHERALQNFLLLSQGRIEEVVRIEEDQFPDIDLSDEAEIFGRNLGAVDWKKLELVYLEEEKPLLSPGNDTLSDDEKSRIQIFLSRHAHDGYSGTSYLLGHHTFFYGAPNSLPEILWPLFKRVEDLSIYPDRPDGVGQVVTAYNIDDEN